MTNDYLYLQRKVIFDRRRSETKYGVAAGLISVEANVLSSWQGGGRREAVRLRTDSFWQVASPLHCYAHKLECSQDHNFLDSISGRFDRTVTLLLFVGQLRPGAKRPNVRHNTSKGTNVERCVSKQSIYYWSSRGKRK